MSGAIGLVKIGFHRTQDAAERAGVALRAAREAWEEAGKQQDQDGPPVAPPYVPGPYDDVTGPTVPPENP